MIGVVIFSITGLFWDNLGRIHYSMATTNIGFDGEHLRKQGYEVVDKRPNGRVLWVVGGCKFKEELWKYKDHGLYFRFARNGSNSTQKRSA